MEEHWRLKQDGSLAGVYGLDLSFLKGADLWAKIDELIAAWVKLHPKEMAEHLLEVEEVRNAQFNEFGSTASKSLRWGASVPVGLLRQLELVEPDLFTKKYIGKFMKKYPAFCVCKRV